MNGVVLMVANGIASFTHGDTTVLPNKDGIFEVPSAFVEFAKAHGFELAPEKKPKDEKKWRT